MPGRPIIYEGTTQIHKMMQAEHALGYRQLNGRGGDITPLASWGPALARTVTAAVAALATALALAGGASAALPDEGTLVPGQTLGGVSIGMSKAKVRSVWGTPFRSLPRLLPGDLVLHLPALRAGGRRGVVQARPCRPRLHALAAGRVADDTTASSSASPRRR